MRHPLAALARFWLPLLVFVVLLVTAGIVASTAGQATGERLAHAQDPLGLLGAMVVVAILVGSWLGGLLLIGVVTAWRGAVWTVAEVSAAGTFGGSTNRRRGDWRADPRSATL